MPRLRSPRFPILLLGRPEAGRDQGAGPPSQQWHSCGDGNRGEKAKSCRMLISRDPGSPRDPTMAVVTLVHGWPPAHGICLQVHSSHHHPQEHPEVMGSQRATVVATIAPETWVVTSWPWRNGKEPWHRAHPPSQKSSWGFTKESLEGRRREGMGRWQPGLCRGQCT